MIEAGGEEGTLTVTAPSGARDALRWAAASSSSTESGGRPLRGMASVNASRWAICSSVPGSANRCGAVAGELPARTGVDQPGLWAPRPVERGGVVMAAAGGGLMLA